MNRDRTASEPSAGPVPEDARVIDMERRRAGERGLCRGRRTDGLPCRNRAGDSGYCRRHDIAGREEDQEQRRAAGSTAAPESAFEEALREILAFLRERFTGQYPIDDFGFDMHLTENALLPLLRPLFDRWWRVRQIGTERIPQEGACLLVSNHSGVIPWDALMMKFGVWEATGRHARLLAADMVFGLPFIGELARKSGNTLACEEDASSLLEAGECLGVFPEGFKGIGKRFSERYKLQRFGRGGVVEVALQTRSPIIPVAIVGAEEIYPMIADLKPLARLLGFPYFPVTPAFPLLGPAGAIPLPSKWIIEYGEPIDTASFGPEAAGDPMFVFNLTDQVREVIQQTLYKNLMARRTAFF